MSQVKLPRGNPSNYISNDPLYCAVPLYLYSMSRRVIRVSLWRGDRGSFRGTSLYYPTNHLNGRSRSRLIYVQLHSIYCGSRRIGDTQLSTTHTPPTPAPLPSYFRMRPITSFDQCNYFAPPEFTCVAGHSEQKGCRGGAGMRGIGRLVVGMRNSFYLYPTRVEGITIPADIVDPECRSAPRLWAGCRA